MEIIASVHTEETPGFQKTDHVALFKTNKQTKNHFILENSKLTQK